MPESATWHLVLTSFLGAFAIAKGVRVLLEYRSSGDTTLDLAGGDDVTSSVYQGGLQLGLFFAGVWLHRERCGGCARSCSCLDCCGCCAEEDDEEQQQQHAPMMGEPPSKAAPRPPAAPAGAAGFFARQSVSLPDPPPSISKRGSAMSAML